MLCITSVWPNFGLPCLIYFKIVFYLNGRQLVTRSAIRVQCLVIEVLKLLIEGLRENFTNSSEDSNKKVEEEAVVDELIPGKSPVLSILEVIFCLLIQKVPVLNSSISGFHSTATGSNDDNDELVAEVVKCLEMLPDLCSDSCIRIFLYYYMYTSKILC